MSNDPYLSLRNALAELTPEQSEHIADSVFQCLLNVATRHLPSDPNRRPEDQLHNIVLQQIDIAASGAPKKRTLN